MRRKRVAADIRMAASGISEAYFALGYDPEYGIPERKDVDKRMLGVLTLKYHPRSPHNKIKDPEQREKKWKQLSDAYDAICHHQAGIPNQELPEGWAYDEQVGPQELTPSPEIPGYNREEKITNFSEELQEGDRKIVNQAKKFLKYQKKNPLSHHQVNSELMQTLNNIVNEFTKAHTVGFQVSGAPNCLNQLKKLRTLQEKYVLNQLPNPRKSFRILLAQLSQSINYGDAFMHIDPMDSWAEALEAREPVGHVLFPTPKSWPKDSSHTKQLERNRNLLDNIALAYRQAAKA